MARTRMQAALPTTAPTRIAAWPPLPRPVARLLAIKPRVEVLQLGGAAGDGAPFATDRRAIADHLAGALGLAPAPVWHSARDSIAEHGAVLALIAGTCGKIGQNIALMAQKELDEIALAGGGNSSAMPHKANPIRAELLVTLARLAAGQASILHHAVVHEQERSGAAWALDWMTRPQSSITAACTLAIASDPIGDTTVLGAPERT